MKNLGLKDNGHKKVKVGMKVVYRGSWGSDPEKETEIEAMELCDMEDCKYGDSVEEIDIENIRRTTFDLTDGHWCYGWQIVEVVG